MDRPKILVIVGPTASGKSALALEVARHFGAEIINADSMQVYRYMDIGTAKPTPEERRLVKHRLIDIVYPDEEFSAGRFRDEARGAIADLKKKGRKAVVVGGTGLYIKALTAGLIQAGEVDEVVRQRLRSKAEKEGTWSLYQRLRETDPITAANLHPHDTYRVIRALETHETTGYPISVLRQRHLFQEQPYRVLKIGLNMERETLYGRIESRVSEMIQRGFKEEVRRLLEMGYHPSLKSMRSLGYKQMVEHLRGDYDLPEAVRRIQRNTRRYARKQITWFKGDGRIRWAEYPQDHTAIFRMIEKFWQNELQ